MKSCARPKSGSGGAAAISDEENTDEGVEGAMMCDERLASRWEGVEEVEDEGAEVGEADGMATDYKGNVNEESHDKNCLKEFTDEIYYTILYSGWHVPCYRHCDIKAIKSIYISGRDQGQDRGCRFTCP